MARIKALTADEAGNAADILNAVQKKIGMVPNIYGSMAHSPAVLSALLGFNGALAEGVLSPALREQIALTIAGENGCDYCASAHTMMAKAAGVSEAEATNNLIAQSDHPRTAAILTFVKQVVVNRGVASDTEVAQLREVGVNDAEFVEILAHVGINLFANYFNNIVEIDIDFPFVQAQKAAA